MAVRMLISSALAWLALFLVPAFAGSPELPVVPEGPETALPFRPGEKLTYDISWSNLLQAGRAVMEVRKEVTQSGRPAYRLTSRARSSGLLSKFYKVSDTIESVIDSEKLCSLSFRLDQRHGKRKKKREMVFNHEEGRVTVVSDDRQDAYEVPEKVQDALSSLYYVRSRREFTVDKPIVLNVHEDGKTWAVEVHTLGREKIKTILGDINTIKVRTYPKYEGVFQNKGEIYIWLTDDERKIPVLMKSTITIGSIVSTLVEMESGEKQYVIQDGIKTSHQAD